MKRAILLMLSLSATFAVACGPLGPIPGGQLSGNIAAVPPDDWSFADAEETVQVETRPAFPYSVNVWGVGIGDRFYIASGQGGEAKWVENLGEDPRVRLRVGDTLYQLRAVRVEDDADRERFLEAVKRKYDWEPSEEERERAWLFRLDPL